MHDRLRASYPVTHFTLPFGVEKYREPYLHLGRRIGAVMAGVVFLVSWSLFITWFGWAWGGGLGWWPALLAAGAAGAASMYLWGPLSITVALLALCQLIG